MPLETLMISFCYFQDSMNLVATNKNKLPVAALCMSFLAGDVNNFVIGGEDGAVSQACRHGRLVEK